MHVTPRRKSIIKLGTKHHTDMLGEKYLLKFQKIRNITFCN